MRSAITLGVVDVNKIKQIKINVANRRILKWMCGVTGLNRIGNEYARECVLGVTNKSGKK